MHPKLVKYIFFLLKFNGCSPVEGYGTSQILLFSLGIILTLYFHATVIIYFFVKEEPIEVAEILDSLSELFFISEAAGKMTALFVLRSRMREFFQQMQTMFWEPKRNEKGQDKGEMAALNRVVETTAFLYAFVTACSLTTFLCIPAFSEGEKLIYEAYRPPGVTYFAALSLQAFTGFTSIFFGIFPFDMLFMILVSCTALQFQLLNEELRNLFDRQLDTKGAVVEFEKELKKCISQYDFLLQYTKNLNDELSIPLTFSLVTMFGCHTVEMYRLAKAQSFGAALRSILFVGAGILIVFMQCFSIPAQRLMDEASMVGENIYCSRWYRHPEYAKSLIIIMSRSYSLVKIVPCGVLELNLEKGLAAIRAMISYSMFLKTVDSMDDHKM